MALQGKVFLEFLPKDSRVGWELVNWLVQKYSGTTFGLIKSRRITVLESHGPATEIGIAIETSHGAWVQALLDRGYHWSWLDRATAKW